MAKDEAKDEKVTEYLRKLHAVVIDLPRDISSYIDREYIGISRTNSDIELMFDELTAPPPES